MMKQIIGAVLLTLCLVQTHAEVINGVDFDLVLGGAAARHIKLAAGGTYTLNTALGFSATFQTTANVEVWFGGSLQVGLNLPKGWTHADLSSISSAIGLGFGFGIYTNVSGALANIVFQSPPIPAFGAQLTADINAGVLGLQKISSSTVLSALVATYDGESHRISVSLPVTLPIIVFGQVQTHISASFGTAISTIAGANQTLQFDASTAITFKSQVANTITVAKFHANAAAALAVAAQAAGTPLGVFLNITLAAAAAHDSTIRITYNATDLIAAGISNAASIKLAFYNELTHAWDFGTWTTFVNETAHYIEAQVPHFSTWAPIAINTGSTITPYSGTTLISNVGIDLTNNALDLAAKTTLLAGNSYTLATGAGFLVVLTANADVKVWVGAHLDFPTLPSGWSSVDLSSFNLGVKVAFGVYANVTGALSNVQLITPQLTFLGPQITAGINAGVLALDQQTNVFSALVATWDAETQRIIVSLPVTLPVIIFGKVSAHVSAHGIFSTIAGANQTIDFDAGTSITFRSQVANTITVAKIDAKAAAALTVAAQAAGTPLGYFLNITLAAAASHESTIRISYNLSDLIAAGISNAANIKLAFYNELTNAWDFGTWTTFVNQTAQYIEAQVPHFSTWAPIALGATYNPFPGTTVISNVIFDPLTGGAASTKVSVVAGGKYTLATTAGFYLGFTANVDAQVWVGASLKFTTNGLPTGWDAISLGDFGINAGFAVGVYTNVTGALADIVLISPQLPFLGAQITAGINAGVLALDQSANTNVFSALVATWDAEAQRITVSLPVTLPVLIFGKAQAHVAARFNSAISTIAGANQTLDFDASTSITFRSQVANTIIVAKSNAAAAGTINALAKAGRPLGIFLNISLAADAAHSSTIRITYNKTDLINAGIQNEANLKLAFYNPTTNTWDFGTWTTTVNTVAHYVEANVPHFSTWAPIEQSSNLNAATSQASVSIILMITLAFLALLQ